ncbi:hypothetical protein Ciccas_007040 [Cichlidogyrus casuarinus]|uniref:Uncharacterized protein n=1 Tax=Cichlidogyrus casuarinus TaxID=1844966 RepID=A0ABD2Q410_9PLAT
MTQTRIAINNELERLKRLIEKYSKSEAIPSQSSCSSASYVAQPRPLVVQFPYPADDYERERPLIKDLTKKEFKQFVRVEREKIRTLDPAEDAILVELEAIRDAYVATGGNKKGILRALRETIKEARSISQKEESEVTRTNKDYRKMSAYQRAMASKSANSF